MTLPSVQSAHAVALLSGGLDSCVALATAVEAHGPATAVLHASYGQRTAARERQAAQALAAHYELALWREIDLSWLADMGQGHSSLTDTSLVVPDATDEGLTSTYVPFRNAVLLTAGIAWAEVLGASQVICGAHAADSSYPDTQPGFFAAINDLAGQGTAPQTQIQVLAPLLDLNKEHIVRQGFELKAPMELTWSCYQRSDRPCQTCHSCHLRAAGFAAAGRPDPLQTPETRAC